MEQISILTHLGPICFCSICCVVLWNEEVAANFPDNLMIVYRKGAGMYMSLLGVLCPKRVFGALISYDAYSYKFLVCPFLSPFIICPLTNSTTPQATPFASKQGSLVGLNSVLFSPLSFVPYVKLLFSIYAFQFGSFVVSNAPTN